MATGHTWPLDLPQVTNLPGSRQQPPDGVGRSTLEGAPPHRRRTHADAPRSFQQPMILTVAQRASLLAFYNQTLHRGALSFDHVNDWNGNAARLRFTGGAPVFQSAGGNAYLTTLSLLEVAS